MYHFLKRSKKILFPFFFFFVPSTRISRYEFRISMTIRNLFLHKLATNTNPTRWFNKSRVVACVKLRIERWRRNKSLELRNGIRGKVEENDGRVDRLVINDRCQARFNRSVSPRLFFSITLSPSRPAPSSTKRVAAVRERETGRFVPDKNSNRDRAKGRWRVSRYRLVYNKPINSTVNHVRPRRRGNGVSSFYDESLSSFRHGYVYTHGYKRIKSGWRVIRWKRLTQEFALFFSFFSICIQEWLASGVSLHRLTRDADESCKCKATERETILLAIAKSQRCCAPRLHTSRIFYPIFSRSRFIFQ